METQDIQQASVESPESAAAAADRDGQVPGVLELVRLLELRIEVMCRELEERREQIQRLTRSLAERDSQLEAAHRELDERRALSERLAEADQSGGDADVAATAVDEGQDARPEAPALDGAGAPQPEAPVEAGDLVAAAMKTQTAEHAEDRAEFDDLLSQLSHWTRRTDSLRDALAAVVAGAAAEVEASGGAFESLSPELQEALRGRHEGLELIGRMVARLPERLPEPAGPPVSSLPLMSEDAWAAAFAGAGNREAAEKKIRETLAAMSSKRYKALSEHRRQVETSRQSLLQFLRAQVLPILDGIDDGEAHSRELIARLKTGARKSGRKLETWYGAYGKLRAEILGLLGQVQVRPLEVRCGAPIDYDRQEPFAVEEDPDLNTEDVKAVARTGYELTLDESGETIVLRPAQVIVVKNAKESSRA